VISLRAEVNRYFTCTSMKEMAEGGIGGGAAVNEYAGGGSDGYFEEEVDTTVGVVMLGGAGGGGGGRGTGGSPEGVGSCSPASISLNEECAAGGVVGRFESSSVSTRSSNGSAESASLAASSYGFTQVVSSVTVWK
jgi:hypothetical protein